MAFSLNKRINHIHATSLGAHHDGQMVFEQLDLLLKQGEITALLGPNGCGKTTLLRTLLGLHPKSAGKVMFGNHHEQQLSPKEKAQIISYVPQYHRLAFGYPVIEMVLMGSMATQPSWQRASKAQREEAESLLETLNIAHLKNKPYTELSGGQRQLVLIARALAQNTPFIFMDEPTNGLDFGNQIKLLEKIGELGRRRHGILMTTHHPSHALQMADRALVMKQGKLIQDGHPQQILDAKTLCDLYQLTAAQLPKMS